MVPEPIRSACLDLMAPVTLSPGPQNHDAAEARYYTTLQRCIDEGRVCTMNYKSPVEPLPIDCRLEPLGVHFAARAWYVLGRTNLHQEVRIFKLARIRRLTPTDRLFPKPKSFRLPQRFRRAWQLNPEGRMHRIELEFSAKVGTNAAEVRWHESQRQRLLPDGRCLMSFHVDGIREIAWWLCGYADQVVVRRPAALRTLLASMHRSAADLYPAPGTRVRR
jgi:predicted DNA-binding transcriptional regulator YafY